MNVLPLLLAVSFLDFFEARNQIANFIITPPANGQVVQAEKPKLFVRETCPGCNGEGKLILKEPDFGQSKGRMGISRKTTKTCPLCQGKKAIEAFVNPNDLALQVSKDLTTFASRHQGKGEIAVGGAFIPNDKYDTLDKDHRKLIEETFGHPCKKCNWTGLEACKKCSGRGIIPCSNNDCKGGWAVVTTTTEKTVVKSGGNSNNYSGGGYRSHNNSRRTSVKETKVNVSPCPVCGGAKFIPCPECSGRRAAPCKKCNGLGIKVKGSSL